MNQILRLFIAVNFSDTEKEYLYRSVQELRMNSAGGNFTHKENLHLTLVFIGETRELEGIRQAMDRAVTALNLRPFSFILEGIGTFRHRDGDIYWVGIRKTQILADLNRALVKELKPVVYRIDEGEFTAHLTLGRRIKVRDGFDRKAFADSIKPIEVGVDRISLMKSERVQGKLVYTEIYHSATKAAF